MSLAKVAVVCGLMALLLGACGIQAKPVAGSDLQRVHNFYGSVDDPRSSHVGCLRGAGLSVHEYASGTQRLPAIQVGSLPTGPTIIFYPTPGTAQGLQLTGQEQGAEVIGSALLYPNQAPASVLSVVEKCVAIGVSG
jgi:hypothetical protein